MGALPASAPEGRGHVGWAAWFVCGLAGRVAGAEPFVVPGPSARGLEDVRRYSDARQDHTGQCRLGHASDLGGRSASADGRSSVDRRGDAAGRRARGVAELSPTGRWRDGVDLHGRADRGCAGLRPAQREGPLAGSSGTGRTDRGNRPANAAAARCPVRSGAGVAAGAAAASRRCAVHDDSIQRPVIRQARHSSHFAGYQRAIRSSTARTSGSVGLDDRKAADVRDSP